MTRGTDVTPGTRPRRAGVAIPSTVVRRVRRAGVARVAVTLRRVRWPGEARLGGSRRGADEPDQRRWTSPDFRRRVARDRTPRCAQPIPRRDTRCGRAGASGCSRAPGHPGAGPAPRARTRASPVAPYDPAWRFEVEVLAAPAGADRGGHRDRRRRCTFECVGRVGLDSPDAGVGHPWTCGGTRGYGGGIFVPLRDGTAAAGRLRRRAVHRSTPPRVPTWVLSPLDPASRVALLGGRWSSTSTSPTTRPAHTTPRGRARWRHPATASPPTCRSASSTGDPGRTDRRPGGARPAHTIVA